MLAHVLKRVTQQEQNVHAGRRMRFQKVEFPLAFVLIASYLLSAVGPPRTLQSSSP